MIRQKTAILIFANSAKHEGHQKSFPKSVALFEELNRQTLEKVKKTGLTYVHFSEKQQVGTSFGERYANAIQAVYDRGFDYVITIGNDTPHLQASQLLETVHKLSKNAIVLGPSFDGGFYLLGIHKSKFDKTSFTALPWQTPQLSKNLIQLLDTESDFVFLKRLKDIDTVIDVKSILFRFHRLSQKLVSILLSIFSSEEISFTNERTLVRTFLKRQFYNKGSPALFS